MSNAYGVDVSSGARLLSPEPVGRGQLALSELANPGLMLVSLKMLSLKLRHCDCPIVCAPASSRQHLALLS